MKVHPAQSRIPPHLRKCRNATSIPATMCTLLPQLSITLEE